MKAVVFHGIGDIRLDDVPDPRIEAPTDAVVRITASAICGTDLHMVRGTFSGMVPGTILGHEAVGEVVEVGPDVRNFRRGDRVVIPSTIACGYCAYCRTGYNAQCDNANPNGPAAGTAFFGGPKPSGPFNGLQAEFARVPFAAANLIKLPDTLSDDQAILLSDIFPTGWFGAELAQVEPGRTVCVFGCGPVGQFAIASAKLMGAGRVFAVDTLPDRLEFARRQGAEVIDYNADDPVETVKSLTGGMGVDRVIDAVGVDAKAPTGGPAAAKAAPMRREFKQEQADVAPEARPRDGHWVPGDAPSQVLRWAVEATAKAGTIGIIGVYPPTADRFPIGQAMNRNLVLRMGNCNHRRIIPPLIDLVQARAFDPQSLLTQQTELVSALEAYESFDARQSGWLKVELVPAGGQGPR